MFFAKKSTSKVLLIFSLFGEFICGKHLGMVPLLKAKLFSKSFLDQMSLFYTIAKEKLDCFRVCFLNFDNLRKKQNQKRFEPLPSHKAEVNQLDLSN